MASQKEHQKKSSPKEVQIAPSVPMMTCRVCKSKNTKFLNYVRGYDGEYEIRQCSDCGAHFSSDPYSNPYKDYKTFYPLYLAQSEQIKKEPNPFQFLLNKEYCYLSVKEAIGNRTNLNILEVGCGYGYLTYTLRKMGHSVEGIDTAEEPIIFAQENFGNNYHLMPVEDYNYKGEFDLVIALGTVEHVFDVFSFLVSCKKLLNTNGKIVLTTPNKDFFPNGIWQTEKPPVHLSWLSRRTFEVLAKKLNMNINFTDFKSFISKNERDNELEEYFKSRLPEAFSAQSFSRRFLQAITPRNFYWLLPIGCFVLFLRNFDFKSIRYAHNLFYRKFLWRKESLTLGVIFTLK